MAEKIGEGLLTALEERPVSISVAAKKKAAPPTKKTIKHLEHVLIAGTDRQLKLPQRQEEAVQRFTDLGLGRGVDATKTKPWLNKTSFQVRTLKFGKLIGTEQGGSVGVYDDVVNSVQSLQLELKQSVSASNVPVNIGTDAEHSRTASNMRHVVGRRVHNRTVSFREELDDIPVDHVAPPTPVDDSPEDKEADKAADGGNEGPLLFISFEERLADWVLERMHCELDKDRPAVERFEDWFVAHNDAETLKEIKQLCRGFVDTFHVTHYVSSIDLGAVEYSVITKEDYSREVNLAGSFGLEDVVSTVLKTKGKYTSSRTHTSTHVRKVGLIRDPESGDYHVERGTYAEAVIGVDVKPVSTLIRHPKLREKLAKAVRGYIEDARDASIGPFLITSESINRETVYLRVDEVDMSLQATTRKREASKFFIVVTDEGQMVHEFHIVYSKEDTTDPERELTLSSLRRSVRGAQRRPPPDHYLATPLTVFGSNNGPLHFELNPKKHHTMFVLHDRLRTRGAPAEPITPWVQGREEYFINCHGRKFARDGYLAVRRVLEGDDVVRYRPVCVPSRRTDPEYFKVFSLVLVGKTKVEDLEASPKTYRPQPPSGASSKVTDDGIQMDSL